MTATFTLAKRNFHVTADFAGRTLTVRLDGHLMHTITNGQIAGSWPSPLSADQLGSLRGARTTTTALPPARPHNARVVERRLPADGIVMVAQHRLRGGRSHAGKIVTIVIDDTHFRALHGEQELSVHGRDPSKPGRRGPYRRRIT